MDRFARIFVFRVIKKYIVFLRTPEAIARSSRPGSTSRHPGNNSTRTGRLRVRYATPYNGHNGRMDGWTWWRERWTSSLLGSQAPSSESSHDQKIRNDYYLMRSLFVVSLVVIRLVSCGRVSFSAFEKSKPLATHLRITEE